MACRGRLVAGFAGTDQHVDDRRFDNSGGGQRPQGQNGRRRVTPGAGHQVRIAQRLPVQFRDPVDKAAQQIRARMRAAVPARVSGGVSEPEVGAQVDDPSGDLAELVHPSSRLPVREAHKEHITAGKLLQRTETEPGRAAQVRMHAVRELPGKALGGDFRYLDLRMAEHQAEQFAAGVAGGPGDGYPDHRSGDRR